MRVDSYEAHLHARRARARFMRFLLRRGLTAASRWRRGLRLSAWLRPLSYG